MKKNGFTLAEVLITLGIVGVAAALLTPIIGNAIPDKNKTKVINLYQAIASTTDTLLNDNSIYYQKGSDDNCRGLGCQYIPLASPYNKAIFNGKLKYGYLLATHLNVSDMTAVTTGNTVEFQTNDNVSWTIQTNNIGESIITLDLNGTDGKNCSYNKTLCPKPDQFEFFVSQYGKIIGNDPLTTAYLGNSLKLNDKKKDYAAAFSDTETYLANLEDKFQLGDNGNGGSGNGGSGNGGSGNGGSGNDNDNGNGNGNSGNYRPIDGDIIVVGGSGNGGSGGSTGSGGGSSFGDGDATWNEGNGWLVENSGNIEAGVSTNNGSNNIYNGDKNQTPHSGQVQGFN